MARPRKWENDAQRRQAQGDRRKAERQAHHVEFIGVDGEGMGRWRDHRYVLLGVGQEAIQNESGLTFTQIMGFLYTQFQENPAASYVGFFLGYDFTQWFKTLPLNRAWMLLTEGGRKKRQRTKYPQLGPFPVTYEGWEFDILGMKRFKLRLEGEQHWMYVCDAGGFFQASLMSVIDPSKWEHPIVTEKEYAILQDGKANRDNARLGASMVRYNALENAVLSRLMGRTNEGLVQAGIRLKRNQWFGPGQAAQAWLTNIHAPTGELVREAVSQYRPSGGSQGRDTTGQALGGFQGQGCPEESELASGATTGRSRPLRKPGRVASSQTSSGQATELLDAGRMSYYGGWFEIFAHGHIPGNTWEYDINSAYPYIISRLPCFAHGKWRHGRTDDRRRGLAENTVVLVHASVSGDDTRIGAMLHRRQDGGIFRPNQTGGWYWLSEITAAEKAGLINNVRMDEWWAYDGCGCKPPMRGIAGLYEERLRVGKNSPHGKGLKLVYNSVYGKFAQSVGNPKFGNAFYASLITAGCRTMILDAIATHERGSQGVLMVATDGVYFTGPHTGLDIGKELGAWEEGTHSNLTLFKPGVYWDDNARDRIREGEAPGFKARGINARAFSDSLQAIDAHFAQWPEAYPLERDPMGPREGWYPKVTFHSGFSMITAVQALQRGKWFLAGAVNDVELVQDADPIGKRHSGYYDGGVYWSRPFKDGGPDGNESYPYDGRFGQPDPDEYGITDDGTVKDSWAHMIMGR